MEKHYLTADEAAARLGVTRATLYAYVSRGLIHTAGGEGDKRRRLYDASDIQRLLNKQEARTRPEAMAERALDWGMPVTESALTAIREGTFYYRGYEVTELAVSWTVEAVAGLLWGAGANGDWQMANGTATGEHGAWSMGTASSPPGPLSLLREEDKGTLWGVMEGLSAVERFQVALPLMAAGDLRGFDLRAEAVAQTGGRILYGLGGLATGRPMVAEGLVAHLVAGWGVKHPKADVLLNAALILCADHELNVSAFTARCIASARATPYHVVQGALSALQGARHGGLTSRVAALLGEAAQVGVRETISQRLARGEEIPGFGHRLYPKGDPRGRLLLRLATAHTPASPALQVVQEVVATVTTVTGEYPTVDMGLVAVAVALGLPPGSALTLFALGRTIGWIAHAIEQYGSERLIRPRAYYVGRRV